LNAGGHPKKLLGKRSMRNLKKLKEIVKRKGKWELINYFEFPLL